MARTAITLSEVERTVVESERDRHPDPRVRKKMLVLWSITEELTQDQTARIAGVGRATVNRYLAAYRTGGLDGLRRFAVVGPVSALAEHAGPIRASLEQSPVRTVAEASDRIRQITGLSRGPSQTRAFLKGLGFGWNRTRALPVPPKKRSPNTSPFRTSF